MLSLLRSSLNIYSNFASKRVFVSLEVADFPLMKSFNNIWSALGSESPERWKLSHFAYSVIKIYFFPLFRMPSRFQRQIIALGMLVFYSRRSEVRAACGARADLTHCQRWPPPTRQSRYQRSLLHFIFTYTCCGQYQKCLNSTPVCSYVNIDKIDYIESVRPQLLNKCIRFNSQTTETQHRLSVSM